MKQNKKFTFGFIAGLVLMSVISSASVTLSKFVAGTPISAVQVNQNFQAINERLEGFTGGLNSNFTQNCISGSLDYNTDPNPYDTLAVVPEYPMDVTSYTTANEYVIPITGIYHAVANFGDYIMGMNGLILIKKSNTLIETIPTSASADVYRKFTKGDRISFLFACYNYMSTNPTMTLDPSKAFFVIKKM